MGCRRPLPRLRKCRQPPRFMRCYRSRVNPKTRKDKARKEACLHDSPTPSFTIQYNHAISISNTLVQIMQYLPLQIAQIPSLTQHDQQSFTFPLLPLLPPKYIKSCTSTIRPTTKQSRILLLHSSKMVRHHHRTLHHNRLVEHSQPPHDHHQSSRSFSSSLPRNRSNSSEFLHPSP